MSTSDMDLPKKFKVAIIQMCPKPLDPEANFAVASAHLRDAASQGARLVILPEYHLSGWEPTNPKFISIARGAHKYQKAYQELAAELKINICAGTIVQTPPEQAVNNTNGAPATSSTENAVEDGDDTKPMLLNISPFIDDKGELLGTYIKTNIWIPERDHLTSSIEYHRSSELSPVTTSLSPDESKTNTIARPQLLSQTRSTKNLVHAGVAHSEPESTPLTPHQIIHTDIGKIGILVCWDLAFPEAFRSLIQQGADLILIPTFWTAFDMCEAGLAINPNAEKLFLESTLVARAFENTCTIVFCNAGGPKKDGYLGLSGVYAPILGRVPPSFEDGEEGMRIVEIDMGIAKVAEGNYKIREDLNGDDWHYGYERATA